jgi:hypothetical protein
LERQRTLLRVAGGGGQAAHVNWLLKRGYLILVKAAGWQRIERLAQRVKVWTLDPADADRQMAWVEQPYPFHKPTRQLLVRARKQDGTWSHSLLLSNCFSP